MTATSFTLPDTDQTREALYISPPMVIGKHEWCCVVYRHSQYGPCTDYHWRRLYPQCCMKDLPPDRWRSHKDWPRYDHNDTYDGLPRRLEKLYLRHREMIVAALAPEKGGAS